VPIIFVFSSYGLRTINLEVTEFYSADDKLKLRASIDDLNDYYNPYEVKIFADPGTVGVPFSFTIYPPGYFHLLLFSFFFFFFCPSFLKTFYLSTPSWLL